jgi:two-component system, OmpR family, response regulator
MLIVEDDKDVSSYIANGFRQAGHTVEQSLDGKDGLYLATTEAFDAIVLDRMLPKVDGLTVLRTLRASGIKTPVLILSAIGEVDDRVAGLNAGGDDYLVKPFAFSELQARVDALLRRSEGDRHGDVTRLSVADLTLDLLRREAHRGGVRIDLQPREFQLLEYLMRHAGQVVTRTMLLESIWGYHFDPKTNVIDVHMSRLRNKIDKNADIPVLHTIRGSGYRLDAVP